VAAEVTMEHRFDYLSSANHDTCQYRSDYSSFYFSTIQFSYQRSRSSHCHKWTCLSDIVQQSQDYNHQMHRPIRRDSTPMMMMLVQRPSLVD
jgi:hypothetical protein